MLLALAAALTAPCPQPWHYDGDAIRCDSPAWRAVAGGNRSMRLARVDAPEIVCQARRPGRCRHAGADESRDHLRAATFGRKVTCRWLGERTSPDSGSRPVVFCTAAGLGDLSCLQWQTRHARYEARFDPAHTFRARCLRQI